MPSDACEEWLEDLSRIIYHVRKGGTIDMCCLSYKPLFYLCIINQIFNGLDNSAYVYILPSLNWMFQTDWLQSDLQHLQMQAQLMDTL